MLNTLHKRVDEDQDGFTLIELLVVVIIIGILAAIAIPTFLNQRQRGWEAAAQTDLRNAAIAQQSHYTQNDTYTTTLADLTDQGFVGTGAVTLTLTTGDVDSYCMTAVHDSGGDAFRLDSETGEIERTEDACPTT